MDAIMGENSDGYASKSGGDALLDREQIDSLVAAAGVWYTFDRLVVRPMQRMAAVAAIHEAAENLVRNPNEELLLLALALRLPSLS